MEITTRPRSRRWRVAGARLLLAAAVVAVCLLLPASVGLSQGVVTDDAMGGSLPRGALTLGRPVETVDQLRVGDVVSFPNPEDPSGGHRVTRRVVAIDGGTLVTRGDARPVDDPWQLRGNHLDATRTVLAVPFAGYPQLWVPWLSWAVVGVLLALAALVALLAAHREAGRDHVTVRAPRGPAAPAATT